MSTPLALVLALGLAFCAAAASGSGAAYVSLLGLASSDDEGKVEEGRVPGDGRAVRRTAVPTVPAPGLRDAVRDEDVPFVAAPRRRVSSWTRILVMLLPAPGSDFPVLKASTTAFAGARPSRPEPPPAVPHEAEEGARRGMAELIALMSAGAEPSPPRR